MTEMQPTEVELTSHRKKPESRSKRKIVALVAGIVLIILAIYLTAVLAHKASRAPESIQPLTVPEVKSAK